MPENHLSTLLQLLPKVSTLEGFRAFLRSYDVPYSASSWQDTLNERVAPALKSRELTYEDLRGFVEEAEEHGRQHIFLYRARDGVRSSALMSRNRLAKALGNRGETNLLERPLVLDEPASPTLAAARWDGDPASLVLKIIETRTYQQLISEEVDPRSGALTRRYDPIAMRAVNLFRLHDDGLLELRVESHRSATKYDAEVNRSWDAVVGLLSRSDFEPVPLTRVRNRVWSEREKLGVRFSDYRVRSLSDIRMDVATGDLGSNLSDDAVAAGSIDSFLGNKAYCDRTNVWLLATDVNKLSRDLHVIIGGSDNEYCITGKCSPHDYEYVLDQIRTLNR